MRSIFSLHDVSGLTVIETDDPHGRVAIQDLWNVALSLLSAFGFP